MDEAPDGWQVWSEADDRLVLVYRPDVFDGGGFPSPCLPTIYVAKGRRDRRPGVARDPPPGTPWSVSLYLEPDVALAPREYGTRDEAIGGAGELAEQFTRGEVDYRGLYQVPREGYLDRLDELTSGEATGDG